MSIVHKAGNILKPSDGLIICALLNTPDNTSYVNTSTELQISTEGTKITDIGREFFEEYSDGFIHDWCKLIPALKLAYKTSIHSSTGETPAILGKKDLGDIHPNASSFNILLDEGRNHANQRMSDYFEYAKKNETKVIKPQN
ncbi:hypothetical protein O181_081937 [Austropuccinia psidii MF-1]|uniref:Uncharacterized protein n=1 Tax=Austropuccinia psidii MF-1 TaxID=1389203 RepID=A0A9Q3FRM5_9BASI|nr:hypothetical protein [Austropuccinia psidii MF-1]